MRGPFSTDRRRCGARATGGSLRGVARGPRRRCAESRCEACRSQRNRTEQVDAPPAVIPDTTGSLALPSAFPRVPARLLPPARGASPAPGPRGGPGCRPTPWRARSGGRPLPALAPLFSQRLQGPCVSQSLGASPVRTPWVHVRLAGRPPFPPLRPPATARAGPHRTSGRSRPSSTGSNRRRW